ncbi:hypothetical protein D9M72_181470 [compost metagenome]
MWIKITHVSLHQNQLTEVGAIENGRLIWCSPTAEAVSRARTGVHFFVEHEGKRIPVEVVSATALRDATLRTEADKVTFELLKALPQLPTVSKSAW